MIRRALAAGVAVPLLYFGTQLVAAPLYPGYDFVTQVASELGSPGSRTPAVFNTGAILTGLACMVASWGFVRALPEAGTPRALAWIVGVLVLSTGLAGLQAGLFPLPHPRHNPGWLGAGLFVMPALLLVATWRARGPGVATMRTLLAACVLLFLLQFPLRAGILGIDPRTSGGLLQRLLALAAFPPIGIVAFWLWHRTRISPPAVRSDFK